MAFSWGVPIYVSHLSLANFRNYESLELDLEPGTILVEGDNGQGKSNLLEAIYILAIAKSPRASADRELVRRQSAHEQPYARVSAVARRGGQPLTAQIDFSVVSAGVARDSDASESVGRLWEPESITVQRYVRINGVPRRSSELIGNINAVMFSAADLELVFGPPTIRRRYLDIVISQMDRRYLTALQRYQRVVYQRNHLLRMLREGRSAPDELRYWDDELVAHGKYVMARRMGTVRTLSELAGPIHGELTGNGESLELIYRPSVQTCGGDSEDELAQDFMQALEAHRQQEVAQAVTSAARTGMMSS